ncbi:hypothetical protein ACB092_09G014500 [Castanea dentata]
MGQVQIFLAIILSIFLLILGVSAQQQIENTQQIDFIAPIKKLRVHGSAEINQKRHSFSKQFLSAHNKVRKMYDEPPLKWNRKLARYARRWAAKRAFDCRMVHSYGPYGENLFWAKHDHWTPSEAVKSWVEEKKYYDPRKKACAQGHMCGHYTQVVWRDTKRVGCARTNCKNGGLYVICVYDPPGNYVNESPFGNPPRIPERYPNSALMVESGGKVMVPPITI